MYCTFFTHYFLLFHLFQWIFTSPRLFIPQVVLFSLHHLTVMLLIPTSSAVLFSQFFILFFPSFPLVSIGSVQFCTGQPPLHWDLATSCMWPGWVSFLYEPSAPKTPLVPGNSWPELSFAPYGLFLNFCTHLTQVSSLFLLLFLLLITSLSPGSFLSSALAKASCSFCHFFCTEFCIFLFSWSLSYKLTAHFLLESLSFMIFLLRNFFGDITSFNFQIKS